MATYIDFQIDPSIPWVQSYNMWQDLVRRVVACWAPPDSNTVQILTGEGRKILRVDAALCGEDGRLPLTLTDGGTDQCAGVTVTKRVQVADVDTGCNALAAPAGLAVSGTPTATSISVAWSAVASAVGYQVQWKLTSAPATAWTIRPQVTALTDTVPGLTASTSYDFQVRAVAANSAQTSPWSATVAVSTAAP
jgi:Fibronectin type III domain